MNIRLPKTGKVERTYKLKLFINYLRITADELKSEVDNLAKRFGLS